MKYLILLTFTLGCSTIPFKYTRSPHKSKPVITKTTDKIERCVRDLIGTYEVKPLEASAICIEIRK